MDIKDIISIVIGILGIGGVIFTVYNSFKNPQIKIEEKQALDSLATEKDKLLAEKDLGTKATILAQKELETKALLLAEQVKTKAEENERRFLEMGKRLDDAFLLASNHTNTVDKKVTILIDTVNIMGNELTKLSTIIEERIPSKK